MYNCTIVFFKIFRIFLIVVEISIGKILEKFLIKKKKKQNLDIFGKMKFILRLFYEKV